MSRLASKGITIDASSDAARRLESLGYTHVVRYVSAHVSLVDAPTFDTLYRDIIDDHAFQGILLAYIIRFERSFKTHLANALAEERGEFAHLEREMFKDEATWRQFVDGSRSELLQKARRGSRYAARIASAGRQVPVWYALEFSSLGTVSKLYANLITCNAKKAIAKHYGVDTSFIESWLASLSFVRNECAHGGVLYGRELEVQPRSHRLFPAVSNRQAFYQALLLSWMMERDVPDLGEEIISKLMPSLSRQSMLVGMGAPEDWAGSIRHTMQLSVETQGSIKGESSAKK